MHVFYSFSPMSKQNGNHDAEESESKRRKGNRRKNFSLDERIKWKWNAVACLVKKEKKNTIKMDYWHSDWFFIQIIKRRREAKASSNHQTDKSMFW